MLAFGPDHPAAPYLGPQITDSIRRIPSLKSGEAEGSRDLRNLL